VGVPASTRLTVNPVVESVPSAASMKGSFQSC
jgi:hypothetical protein